MKSPIIKFSHPYFKLLDSQGNPVKKATLLQVIPIAQDKLTAAFLEYDTTHATGKYALKYETVHLVLIFLRPDGTLFTTIRPQWNGFGNKEEYYKGLCGKEFDIIINTP